MIKKSTLFILLIFGGEISAQQGDYRSIITVSGFAPLRDYRWNIGYLYRLNERWWLGAEVAYGQNGITPYPIEENDYKIFEVKPEVYYSLAPDSRLKHFISAEFSYLNHQSKKINEDYTDGTGAYYHFQSADYERTRQAVSINYSILLHRESSWFGFMPKVGIGIAHRKITYRNIEGKEDGFEPIDVFSFLNNRDREQQGFRLHFNVDMKFVFKF
ncbi:MULTISPECIES: hypothetical protein [Chryseobacterium]|uniref:DUF3575 domain-containing protein n=1 Tax=Chryseobacterium camelliae TaxID=1265445 RepID=A0ABU0THM9_9FLAO|nr:MULTISPECIES: hypothetical protein [Chryseobacterium]MDT3409573.1 hypothetical protein [Pseudacidovorax intermedius]MDQ1096566.1 hypothetical protein [Chryseobacterium camelliae]MDQ1100507.1 hypothetical protein [Chryseobacterium sp. SORGH_AS_1048]MDR6087847.1 hypothetical protein [Chryseobacterium sp. SORGH_AS_0909]MDR6132223.1 hypothetical protein [Chryseobacterium sp. SORGH_AS_1175]